jgi:hypothetical protein
MTGSTPDEQNLEAFKYLLENHAGLFTREDRAEVVNLLSTIPDNIQQLSDAIALWCNENPTVLNKFLELPMEKDFMVRAAGNRPTPLDPTEAKKDLLDNLTRQSHHSDNAASPLTQVPSPPPTNDRRPQ